MDQTKPNCCSIHDIYPNTIEGLTLSDCLNAIWQPNPDRIVKSFSISLIASGQRSPQEKPLQKRSFAAG